MNAFLDRMLDRILRLRWFLLGTVAAVTVLSSTALLRLRFDMSFRPLFVSDPVASRPTEDFEAVFGQSSGAYIGVILSGGSIRTSAFLRGLDRLADSAARLEHVTQVMGLTRLYVPVSMGGIPAFVNAARDPLSLKPVWEAEESIAAFFRNLDSHPDLRRLVLSADGKHTLLLARVDLPLEDLPGRRRVLERFEAAARALAPPAELLFTGVSAVETAYADIVLESVGKGFLFTTLGMIAVLFLLFRRVAPVCITLASTGVGLPITMGIMHLLGQKITLINSVVPTVVLIIGVGDAIHMQSDYGHKFRVLGDRRAALYGMFREMAFPCFMTGLTTALGFLSLLSARITAIQDFGLNVFLGVWVVYLSNQILVPILLDLFPPSAARETGSGMLESLLDRVALLSSRKPMVAMGLILLPVIWLGTLIPSLSVSQRFNEELAPAHPASRAQALMEKHFTGYLGPELDLRRKDGGSLLDAAGLDGLRAFADSMRKHPEVIAVHSLLDFIPVNLPDPALVGPTLLALRSFPDSFPRASETVNRDGTRAGILIRTRDMGSGRSEAFGNFTLEKAGQTLGEGFEFRLVGQWTLAQQGMRLLLGDMLRSFTTSALTVLPFMLLLVRDFRLFLISLAPNLLPTLFAVGFMAATGMTLRIGTAMILAISLGISVDDSIHFLARLRSLHRSGLPLEQVVRGTVAQAGPGMFYATVILTLGFLSMVFSELRALRDMGLVAAATMVFALLCDLFLNPALYRLLEAGRSVSRAQADP